MCWGAHGRRERHTQVDRDPVCRRGSVRLTGRELADQKRSRLSRSELTPFSERGSAVLLEDIAAVEVAVLVDVVVDRGIDGGMTIRRILTNRGEGAADISIPLIDAIQRARQRGSA